METIRDVEKQYLKKDIPDFSPGDQVRVHAVSYTHLEKKGFKKFKRNKGFPFM